MSDCRFWVEMKWADGEWRKIAFAESNAVQYCHGWLDCMDALYPSRPHRICKRVTPSTMKVLRETKGRPKAKVNK
jgi:hypothetical protein